MKGAVLSNLEGNSRTLLRARGPSPERERALAVVGAVALGRRRGPSSPSLPPGTGSSFEAPR